MRRLGEGMGARNLAESVPITTLSIVVLAVTASVIAMGGMIRIYDAGESCPDWLTCFGTWGFDVSEDEQESGGMRIRRRRIHAGLPTGILLSRFLLSGSIVY